MSSELGPKYSQSEGLVTPMEGAFTGNTLEPVLGGTGGGTGFSFGASKFVEIANGG